MNYRACCFPLLLAMAVVLLVRMPLVCAPSMPFGDGGLFAQMAEDLRSNHFKLPSFTKYNALQIPYAYPPLAFYITAILSTLFACKTSLVMSVATPCIGLINVALAWALARSLKLGTAGAFAAALIAGIGTSQAHVFPGGITRIFGSVFGVAAVYWMIVFRSNGKLLVANLAGCALGCSLLSHFEGAIWGVAGMFSVWATSWRHSGWIPAMLRAGLIAGMCVGPWALYVISIHGTSPFVAAFGTAGNRELLPVARMLIELTVFPNVFLSALAFVGIAVAIKDRIFVPVVWLMLGIFLTPRSEMQFASVPAGILAGLAVDRFLIPIGESAFSVLVRRRHGFSEFWQLGIVLAICAVPALQRWQFFHQGKATLKGLPYPQYYVNRRTSGTAQLFEWLRHNGKHDGSVLVLSGIPWFIDDTAEWLPYETKLVSLGVPQGREWISSKEFHAAHVENIRRLWTLSPHVIRKTLAITDGKRKPTYIALTRRRGVRDVVLRNRYIKLGAKVVFANRDYFVLEL